MPRIPRGQVAGHAYHVLNRGNGGAAVFHKEGDYTAFLDLLATAKAKHPVKLLGAENGDILRFLTPAPLSGPKMGSCNHTCPAWLEEDSTSFAERVKGEKRWGHLRLCNYTSLLCIDPPP